MSNLVLIVICLTLGLALQRMRRLPENSAQVLNQYVINIALPALILAELPKLSINTDAVIPLMTCWVAMVLSVIFVLLLIKVCNWSREVSAVMLLLVPLGNTSFVGFPMVEALLGQQALPYAIIYDQLGSFVAVSTYGMLVLAYYSGDSISPKLLVIKLFSFPPFIAVIAAIFLIGREHPVWLYEALARIGYSLVPVVMVAVGLQWHLRLDRAYLLPLSLALILKLLLIPALLWFGMSNFQVTGLAAQTALLESSMPAMITAGALLASHNLAPRLASSIVGYGLLISLATVPLWSMITR